MAAAACNSVIMADDDLDDCRLAADAFREAKVHSPLYFVRDGEKLLDYLRCEGAYSDRIQHPVPSLILLDLNMPRMDGHEVLIEMKRDPQLKTIPVVVLTTSHAREVEQRVRAEGCDGLLTKPASFTELVEMVRMISQRWLDPSLLACRDEREHG